MENFELSVQRFDQFADEYAQRFIDLNTYSDSIDRFCDLIGNNHQKNIGTRLRHRECYPFAKKQVS